jgi:predicted NAD/FAD-binding protein
LRLLADPSTAERSVLGAIGYQPNVATLHTDERLLPRARRARASWNFRTGLGETQPTLTYWMNRLQSLPTEVPVLVTLNQPDAIDPTKILHVERYAHPVFDTAAMAAQARRHEIQGRDGTWFAGAYWRYGFHEDGVMSGLDVVDGIRGVAGRSRTERP